MISVLAKLMEILECTIEPTYLFICFPFKSGDKVLIHRPYHESDGPNPKLYSPWHGPYIVTYPTVDANKIPMCGRPTKGVEPL